MCIRDSIGALSSTAFPGTTNGAVTLTNVVGAIFGPVGSVLLAAVFIIACFNTVSYTHLDVYKRQALLIMLNWGIV